MLQFLKPYRPQVLLTLALVLFQTLTELYLPALMASIVDRGVVPGDIGHIWRTGGLMLLVAGVGVATAIATTRISSRTSSAFGRDLRRSLFRRVTDFSMHEFNELGTATLITRTTNDVDPSAASSVHDAAHDRQRAADGGGRRHHGVSTDTGLSWSSSRSCRCSASSSRFLPPRRMPIFRSLQEKIDTLNRVVRERLTGVRVVRAFNREEHESRRFGGANRDLTDTGIRVHRLMALAMPLMMVILNMTTVAIVWFGGLRIDKRPHASGRLDGVHSIRHANYVFAADGDDDVRHLSPGGGVGGAHQRSAGDGAGSTSTAVMHGRRQSPSRASSSFAT